MKNQREIYKALLEGKTLAGRYGIAGRTAKLDEKSGNLIDEKSGNLISGFPLNFSSPENWEVEKEVFTGEFEWLMRDTKEHGEKLVPYGIEGSNNRDLFRFVNKRTRITIEEI